MIHEKQRENLLNGGKMFLLECTEDDMNNAPLFQPVGWGYVSTFQKELDEHIIKYCCRYKVGDEIIINELEMFEMGYDESECDNHSFKVKSIKCVKMQDLTLSEGFGLRPTGNSFDKYIDSIFGQGTFESNPYMFLVEVE